MLVYTGVKFPFIIARISWTQVHEASSNIRTPQLAEWNVRGYGVAVPSSSSYTRSHFIADERFDGW